MKDCPICTAMLIGITDDITYCDSCGYIVINNSKKILKSDLILQHGKTGKEFNKKNITYIECVPYINKYFKRLLLLTSIVAILAILTMVYSRF